MNASTDGRKNNRGGFRGPVADLRRQIAFNETMAQRVLDDAQRKSDGYKEKVERLKREMAEAEAAEESNKI